MLVRVFSRGFIISVLLIALNFTLYSAVTCSKCKYDQNSDTDEYCLNCAQALYGQVTCQKCKYDQNTESDKYCLNCAKPLSGYEEKSNTSSYGASSSGIKFIPSSKPLNQVDIKKCLANLKSPDPVLRGRAVLDLYKSGVRHHFIISPLIHIIGDEGPIAVQTKFDGQIVCSNDSTVGAFAAETLCNIGKDVHEPLMVELKRTTSAKARRRMIKLLSKLKDPRSFDYMINCLKKNNDILNRVSAVEYFSSIKDPRSIPLLKERIRAEAPQVQVAIAEVFLKKPDDSMVPILLKLLKSRNEKVLVAVLEVLGAIGNRSTTMEIVKLLQSQNNTSVHNQVFKTLEKLKDPRALKYITKAIENPKLANTASNALYKCVDVNSIPTLSKLLNSKHPVVFQQCVYAMIRIKDPKIVPHLLPILKRSKDQTLRMGILVAIGDLKGPVSKSALMKYAKSDPLPYFRKTAVKNLRAYLDDIEVFDLVVYIMNTDKSKEVRIEAAAMVYSSGTVEGLEALEYALENDKDILFKKNAKNFIRDLEGRLQRDMDY